MTHTSTSSSPTFPQLYSLRQPKRNDENCPTKSFVMLHHIRSTRRCLTPTYYLLGPEFEKVYDLFVNKDTRVSRLLLWLFWIYRLLLWFFWNLLFPRILCQFTVDFSPKVVVFGYFRQFVSGSRNIWFPAFSYNGLDV